MKLKVYIAALHGALLCLLLALNSPVCAGSMLLLGEGTPGAAAPTYQGPGDVVAGATVWYSCARVNLASQASTSTSLCDLVALTTPSAGAVVCTLRATAGGLVDLAASYCNGTTPSAACTAAGGCRVAKMYDLSTGGTNHATNVTLASMPDLVFNAINGLPGVVGVNSRSSLLTGISNISFTSPTSISGVFKRTGTTGSLTTAVGMNSGLVNIGGGTAVNTIVVADNAGGSLSNNTTSADNAFHAVQGVNATSSSALQVDGTDATGTLTASGAGLNPLRILRGNGCCSMDGVLMEGGIWVTTTFSLANRNDLNTNQHGTSGYNF